VRREAAALRQRLAELTTPSPAGRRAADKDLGGRS